MLRFHLVSRVCRAVRSVCRLAVIAAALLPSAAHAAVQWHADLATAKGAAAASGRPVLAVFAAGWAGSPDAAQGVLGSPESEALVSACFEPLLWKCKCKTIHAKSRRREPWRHGWG